MELLLNLALIIGDQRHYFKNTNPSKVAGAKEIAHSFAETLPKNEAFVFLTMCGLT